MVAAGLWGLARDSAMGNDEVATRWAAGLPLRQLALLLRHVDAVHGLYYLLMHGWLAVGTSPAVLRIPSVLAMALAAALLTILGRRLTGSAAAGLLGGLVMAVTPVITYYAQTARSYALVLACVLAATLALLHALAAEASRLPRAPEPAVAAAGQPAAGVTRSVMSGPGPAEMPGPGSAGAGMAGRRMRVGWWAAYAGLMVLAGYLNEMALLVIAAHAVTIALARPGRAAAVRWAAAAAAAAVAVSPLAVLSDREDGAVTWISPPGPHDLLVLFHDYFGATTGAAVLVAACAGLALLPGHWGCRGAGGRPAGRQPAPRRPLATGPAVTGLAAPGPAQAGLAQGPPVVTVVSVALPLLIIPAALLLAESVVTHPLYVDRYVLYGEAGAALLAGAGLARAGQWLAQSLARWRPEQAAGGGAQVAVPGSAAEPRPPAPHWPRTQPGQPRQRAAWRAAGWALGVVVIAGALVLQLGPQRAVRTPASRLFDFGGPSQYIGVRARPGDGILYFGRFFRKAELGYPADYRDARDFGLAVSPARSGSFQGINKPAAAAVALMPRFRRIWVLGRAPSLQLPPGPAVAETRLLREQYTLIAQRQFRGLTVTLWQRDQR
jgi:mannosyltransferase